MEIFHKAGREHKGGKRNIGPNYFEGAENYMEVWSIKGPWDIIFFQNKEPRDLIIGQS